MAGLYPPISTAFVVIAKKAYKPLYDENDELLVSNLGAIRLGFDAMAKEDASDQTRANEIWESIRQLLIREEDNMVGAGAQGTLQMQDDFEMEALGVGL